MFFVPKLIVYSLLCRIALRDVLGESGGMWSKAVGFALLRIVLGIMLMFPAGLLIFIPKEKIDFWMFVIWPLMVPFRWLAWRATMQFMRNRFDFAGFFFPRTNPDVIWTIVAVVASSSLDLLTVFIFPDSNTKMAC